MITVKDLVSGGQQVHFMYYNKGELWYQTDTGFKFPVPMDDTEDGVFLAVDKAMLFMRYIRKHLANIDAAKQEFQTLEK